MAAVDPGTLMWTTACEMIDRAERLHRQFFQPTAAAIGELSWEPPIDIIETDSEIVITVALPGVDRDDVKVTLPECASARRPCCAPQRRRACAEKTARHDPDPL
jgi:HSP20 family protein